MRVKINYGSDEVTKSLPEGTTVSQLLANDSIRTALEAPDASRLKAVSAHGDEMGPADVLYDGDVITLEAKSCSKA